LVVSRGEKTLKTVCIVQARSTSARLPKKVLAPIAGRPLIYHVLDRAAAIPRVDELVVTIPQRDCDLRRVLESYGVTIYAGPEHDVLRRFALAAEACQADIVVRVTGDCPLLAPEAATEVLTFVRDGCEYAWNDTRISGWPDGMDVEAFTARALFEADRHVSPDLIEGDDDREHVTPFIRRRARHTGFASNHVGLGAALSKVSVDTAEELNRVRRIIGHVKPSRYSFEDTFAAAVRAGEWSCEAVEEALDASPF
jgi:spore coat polysaccharide biosynthesis protein SpsF (cytidylyltransferase family)